MTVIPALAGKAIALGGNPDLELETSVNSEIALYWESPNRHNANITVFQNDFKDKISRQEASCVLPPVVRSPVWIWEL